jgi:hypothetical protein
MHSNMHSNMPVWVKVVRGFLWVAPLYLIVILAGIYGTHRPGLHDSIHILGLGIFFGTIGVMTILYQSKGEQDLEKQLRHLTSATVLLGLLYGLCSLLSFSFSGRWAFPYAWF